MNSYFVESTYNSPEITLDWQNATLEIAGKSIPENAIKVYGPVIDWIDQYLIRPKDKTVINIRLSFFNTSTSKYLMELFKRFEEVYRQGFDVQVNWYYDDYDIYSIAQDYKALVDVPMNFIASEGALRDKVW